MGGFVESTFSKIGKSFDSVVKGIGASVQAIEKNPLPLIEAVAITSATGGLGGAAATEMLGAEALNTTAYTAISTAVPAAVSNAAVAALNGGSISQIATAGITAGLSAGLSSGLSATQVIQNLTQNMDPAMAQTLASATGQSVGGAISAILQGKDPVTGALSGAVSGALSSSLTNGQIAELSKANASFIGSTAGAATNAKLNGASTSQIGQIVGNSLAYGATKAGLNAAYTGFTSLQKSLTDTLSQFNGTKSQIDQLQTTFQNQQNDVQSKQTAAQDLADKLDAAANAYADAKTKYETGPQDETSLQAQVDAMTAAANTYNSLKPNYDTARSDLQDSLLTYNKTVDQLNTLGSQLKVLGDRATEQTAKIQSVGANLQSQYDAFTKDVSAQDTSAAGIQARVDAMSPEAQKAFDDSIANGKTATQALADASKVQAQIAPLGAQTAANDQTPSDIQQLLDAFKQNTASAGPGVQVAALTPENEKIATDAANSFLSGALDYATATKLTNNAIESDIANGHLKPVGDGSYVDPAGIIYAKDAEGVWVPTRPENAPTPDATGFGGTTASTQPDSSLVAPPALNAALTPTGALPTAPANVAAASSTVAPSTLDTVAKTNQDALTAAIKTNNPDLVNAVVNNNAPVITALAAGDVTGATNLIGGGSGSGNGTGSIGGTGTGLGTGIGLGASTDQTVVPTTAANQTVVPTTAANQTNTDQTNTDQTSAATTDNTNSAPTGYTGPVNIPISAGSASSSNIIPAAAAATAGAGSMSTSGTSGYKDPTLDFTPHFVKGTQISLVGAPKFDETYITPEQTKVSPIEHFNMGGYAEGSDVSFNPQFAHGRAQFLQGLISPMVHPQIGHVRFEHHSEGHEVGEHQPEFYSEGGLNSMQHTYVTGDGDGTSDSIPAMLANGEFVIPADVVASLGNGSNEAGASVLDQFMKVIREHKRDAHPDHLPPDSKGPLAYLQEAQKKVA
jgi:hypothetical protein